MMKTNIAVHSLPKVMTPQSLGVVEEIKQLDNAEEIMNLPNSWEERGYNKGIQTVIENMLRKDIAIEFIAEVTGASIDEIEKIKNEMKL